MDINDYNYYINQKVREDIIYKPLIYIKNKIKTNFNYLYHIIKEEDIKNRIKDSSGKALIKFIENKYNNITIDHNNKNLSITFKKDIEKYKKNL